MMERRWHFLVVTRGKPSARSKRIWWPNTLQVPVPVRSLLKVPDSRARRISSRYCFMPYIPLAIPPPDEGGTEQNHWYTEQLTHGQPAEGQVADMGIRLAEEFDEKAESAIAHGEQAAYAHGRARPAGKEPEYDKQHHTLQGELVELRRVARQLQRIGGKYHGPGHIGRSAPQLGIDEVADPPGAQTNRHQRCDEVHQPKEAHLM